MKTNASDLVIKACLSQKSDEKFHFIAYFSRKLLSAKQNYEVHDKKVFVIIVILK